MEMKMNNTPIIYTELSTYFDYITPSKQPDTYKNFFYKFLDEQPIKQQIFRDTTFHRTLRIAFQCLSFSHISAFSSAAIINLLYTKKFTLKNFKIPCHFLTRAIITEKNERNNTIAERDTI